MTFPRSADDRPDPADQHAVHARVPEHVSRGVFSTGVIIMTAPTEFVIDFIQNLGRPHQVVARVIMPHPVLPQFVDALLKNIELYRGRYGNLPQPNISSVLVTHAAGPVVGHGGSNSAAQTPKAGFEASVHPPAAHQPTADTQVDRPGHSAAALGTGSAERDQTPLLHAGSSAIVGAGLDASQGNAPGGTQPAASEEHVSQESAAGGSGAEHVPPRSAGASHVEGSPPGNHRRASAQEIYDDLKMRDEIHSGSYANAVMIGHGPHEFSFDFITNFYPQSAVSARVFLAAGQVARLAESLRGAWDQIRHRFQPPPGGENPFQH